MPRYGRRRSYRRRRRGSLRRSMLRLGRRRRSSVRRVARKALILAKKAIPEVYRYRPTAMYDTTWSAHATAIADTNYAQYTAGTVGVDHDVYRQSLDTIAALSITGVDMRWLSFNGKIHIRQKTAGKYMTSRFLIIEDKEGRESSQPALSSILERNTIDSYRQVSERRRFNVHRDWIVTVNDSQPSKHTGFSFRPRGKGAKGTFSSGFSSGFGPRSGSRYYLYVITTTNGNHTDFGITASYLTRYSDD